MKKRATNFSKICLEKKARNDHIIKGEKVGLAKF